MELQYLFSRLFLKLQFHSTVPVSGLPPSVPWATPPGHRLACWIHFCFIFLWPPATGDLKQVVQRQALNMVAECQRIKVVK